MEYHPDKAGAAVADELKKREIEAHFQKIQDAYETLSDPAKRREYDSTDDFDDTLPSTAHPSEFFKVCTALSAGHCLDSCKLTWQEQIQVLLTGHKQLQARTICSLSTSISAPLLAIYSTCVPSLVMLHGQSWLTSYASQWPCCMLVIGIRTTVIDHQSCCIPSLFI